jgi:cleavage and polyadenylation specificity factor subunit 3
LLSLNHTKANEVKVYNPQNAEEVRIPFRKDKIARVVGRLAQIDPPKTADPEDTQILNGVLVQNGFKLSLMAPEDLGEYAGLTTTTIMCKQHIKLSAAGIDLIRWALESTFGAIDEVGESNHIKPEINGQDKTSDEKSIRVNGNGAGAEPEPGPEPADEEIYSSPSQKFCVMGCVSVTWSGRNKDVELEWEGNGMNDGIADAVMAVLLTVESSPAAVKYSSSRNGHHHPHNRTNGEEKKPRNAHAQLSPEDRFARLCMFLEEQFGQDRITPLERPKMQDAAAVKPEDKAEGAAAQAAAAKDVDHDHEQGEEAVEEQDVEELEAAERARLAALGIPVPGLEIRVDKLVARLWLESLEVECANAVLRARVKAVVERAVETVAPLWTVNGMARR